MDQIWYCFMGVTAILDLIKREIPGWIFWVFGIVGIIGAAVNRARDCGGLAGGLAGSVAVGVLLLIISRLVRGSVGEGDGWFFVVSGLYVSWKINLGLLCYGLILSSIYGMLLTVWGAVKGISVRKKKIPFLPFVFMAGIFMYAGHVWP